MGVLLLVPEIVLQLSDRLLPAKHRLGGHSQFVCHRGQRVLHALHGQLVQLQLPWLQQFALLKQ